MLLYGAVAQVGMLPLVTIGTAGYARKASVICNSAAQVWYNSAKRRSSSPF
jgi:hypothetical protein